MAWNTKPLGDLCEILDNRRKPVTKSDRKAGPYPYYGATGVQDYVADFLFDEPLILLGEDGAKWESGERSAFAISGKCWVNNHAHVLRPNRAAVLDQWLIHYLNHADLMEWVSGVTVPKLNQGNMREIPIPLPSVSEQQRIVNILDEAFIAIATATANTEKNLQNAQSIFDGQREHVVSSADATWRERALSEVCSIECSLVDPREKVHAELIHIGGANIESKSGRILNPKTATDEGLISGKFLFGPEVVLYSKIRPYQKKVARPGFRGLCSADIYPLTAKPEWLNRDFLFHVLLSAGFTDFANKGSARAGMPKVNRDHLFSYRLKLPTTTEQARRAKALDVLAANVSKLKLTYEHKITALAELKAALLHHAFTGQLAAHDRLVATT